MKKIFGILMIFSLVLVALNSIAQENRQIKVNMTPEEKAEKRTEHLKEKLSLNDAQSQSVYELIFEQEMQKEKERASRKDRATRIDMSMQNILDDKQLSQYNEMKSNRKKEVENRGKMMRAKSAHGKCCEAK